MALIDIWDYIRVSGDRRLRKQGYVNAGMGILERYGRSASFWGPHLERNRANLLEIGEKLGPERGGTLLILGAGRLLDVPWEKLFPRFARVVLSDADFAVVPYVERLVAAAKIPGMPKVEFDLGDLTETVVDVAAWAEHTISAATSPAAAAQSLATGFDSVLPKQPKWAREYSDLRLVVSTNLLSQLGHFPRLHVQTQFNKRFQSSFEDQTLAARSLETYFNRVRARHIQDMAAQRGAWLYVASDIGVVVYSLKPERDILHEPTPPNAGVTLEGPFDPGKPGEVKFHWPVEIVDRSDPLNGQKIRELWPSAGGSAKVMQPPQRWVWHIVPQGSEKKYLKKGRVHIVEAWTRPPQR